MIKLKILLVICLTTLTLPLISFAGADGDTEIGNLEITAELIDIAGKFQPNDLYDYVYIMKYKVLKVIKGEYKAKTILIGHFNPLLSRTKIKGEMAEKIKGNLKKFSEGDKHSLVLGAPMEDYWDDAVMDEYFDDDEDSDRYFAIKADLIK